MNGHDIISKLKIDGKMLDDKKQQTDYKIKYVVEYIKLWLIISAKRDSIKNINFIDCMSNAGIYRDGGLGTAIEVLLLFLQSAKLHPDKTFNLFFNDYESSRVEILKSIISLQMETNTISNLNVFVTNMDVNDYLKQYDNFNRYLKDYGSTVIFVDPYDLGTVVIDGIRQFLNTYYCELIFNFFTSDYVRNGLDNRILNCVGNADISNKDDLIEFIGNSFLVGKISHVFSYKFKTSTNTELYQIIFATPSAKGLDILKQSLWAIFNGKFNHRNYAVDENQISLITIEDEKQLLLSMHAHEARGMILKEFQNVTVSYSEIESYLADKTVMMTAQFLGSVVKPLLAEGLIEKCGNVKNKSNYKDDWYSFSEGAKG